MVDNTGASLRKIAKALSNAELLMARVEAHSMAYNPNADVFTRAVFTRFRIAADNEMVRRRGEANSRLSKRVKT